MSHRFLSEHEDLPIVSEADGIDFEGEYAVITDCVAMGTSTAPQTQVMRFGDEVIMNVLTEGDQSVFGRILDNGVVLRREL